MPSSAEKGRSWKLEGKENEICNMLVGCFCFRLWSKAFTDSCLWLVSQVAAYIFRCWFHEKWSKLCYEAPPPPRYTVQPTQQPVENNNNQDTTTSKNDNQLYATTEKNKPRKNNNQQPTTNKHNDNNNNKNYHSRYKQNETTNESRITEEIKKYLHDTFSFLSLTTPTIQPAKYEHFQDWMKHFHDWMKHFHGLNGALSRSMENNPEIDRKSPRSQ